MQKDNQFPGRVVLTAHDEVVYECPASQADYVQSVISSVMVAVATSTLSLISHNSPIPPVHVDLGVGRSWADKP